MNRGLALILSGPSGSGKSTIVGYLRQRMPQLLFSVSCTTRAPRQGEIDGTHYHFLSKEHFLEMREQGEFLEWAEVHGNFYGTPRLPLVTAIDAGQTMILDIDVQGMRLVKASLANTPYANRLVSVFVTVPSLEELERRLRGRGTESEESIQRRLKNAVGEIACAGEYDHTLVNDVAQEAANRLYEILQESL